MVEFGRYENHPVIWDTTSSFNSHILITGKSGSGKTVELQKIITSLAADGHTVLVLDHHNIFAEDQIFHTYKASWDSNIESVDAYQDGICFPYLQILRYSDGFEEDQISVLTSLSEIFGTSLRFGTRQTDYLYEALQTFANNDKYHLRGISALDQILASYEDDVIAQRVRQKIKIITSRNLFRNGDFFIKNSKINLLRLSHFALPTQQLSIELVLSVIWRYANTGRFKNNPLYIVLDECQNIATAPQSAFLALLAEGRKLGVNLVLSTQLLQNQRKRFLEQMLLQVSTLLIFRPAESDIGKVARLISPTAAPVWQKELRSLRVGEFVLVGNYQIGERHFSTPLRISGYEESRHSDDAESHEEEAALQIQKDRRSKYVINHR